MPILSSYIPTTDFGVGFPDLGPINLLSYILVLSFVIKNSIGKKDFLIPMWIIIVAVYSLITLLSVSWSDYFSYSGSTLVSLFDSVFIPLIIGLIAIDVFRVRENINFYIKNLIIASTILGLFAFCQMLMAAPLGEHETFRSSASLSNPNSLAFFLVLTVPCLLYGLEKKLLSLPIVLLANLSVLLGVVSTVSRKGYVTYILAFLLFFYFKKKYTQILILLITCVVLAVSLSQYNFISARFFDEKVFKDVQEKHDMRAAGLDLFSKSPFIGHGFRGYHKNWRHYFPHSVHKEYDAHNIFITVLANYGLLGFIPFIFIFIHPSVHSIRYIMSRVKQDNDEKLFNLAVICFISVVSFAICGFWGGGLIYNVPVVVMFYSNIAMFIGARYWEPKKISSSGELGGKC